MIHISINKRDFSISTLNYRYKKTYFNKQFTVFFIGNFRTPIFKIENIIQNLKKKNFEEENLENIFSQIDGICCLLISSKNDIKVCASIYHPYLKVFKTKNKILITEEEFDVKKKISNEKTFLKLFVHHSFFIQSGLSSDVIDFICPGSILTINKKDTNDYKFSWYLNFDKFCSDDNHEQIAKDLAENLVRTFDNLKDDKEYLLALSGGIDSALLLAAANHSKIDIKPFHFTRAIYSDELATAKNVSKYFKKKLKKIYTYDKKFSILNKSDNIQKIIDNNYSLTKTDSVFFPINNADSFANLKFNNNHIFNGDEFPTLLTISHYMSYPDMNQKKIMGYGINKDKRFFYSIKFFEELLGKKIENNFSNFEENFKDIHSYYYPILSTFYEQSPEIISKYIDNNFEYFKHQNNIIGNDHEIAIHHIQELKINNTNLIIKKILDSSFFRENLKIPDSRVAQILTKFLKFLSGAGKSIHQSTRLSLQNNISESVGLNSSVILKELSTIIDDKLVSNSKWHIFRAFEILSGTNFEKLYKITNNKTLKYLIPRIGLRVNSIIKNTNEWDDRFALINNKFFNKFVDENKFEQKFNDFKASHDFRKLIYNFPEKEVRNSLIDTNNNFWKLNNIINIMSYLD